MFSNHPSEPRSNHVSQRKEQAHHLVLRRGNDDRRRDHRHFLQSVAHGGGRRGSRRRSHGVITALTRMREGAHQHGDRRTQFRPLGQGEFSRAGQIGEQEFQKAFQEALANTQTPQRRAAIERLAAMGKEWQQQGLTPLIALRQEINAGRASFAEMEALVRSERGKAKMDEIRVTFAQIIEKRFCSSNGWKDWTTKSEPNALGFARQGAVAFALAITLMALARSIGGRIAIALQAAEATAAGDLTAEVRVEGSDEIGRMLQAVATMQQSLREMLGEIRRNTDHLSEAATTLAARRRRRGARRQ